LVRLWNPGISKPLSAEHRMGYQVLHVTFSEDGQLFAACSVDGTARVWETETGEPVTPPLRHSALGSQGWFTARAQPLVSLCEDGRAYVWDLAPLQGTLDDLEHLAELLKGDSDPGSAGVSSPVEAELERAPDILKVSPAAIAAWHGREAR